MYLPKFNFPCGKYPYYKSELTPEVTLNMTDEELMEKRLDELNKIIPTFEYTHKEEPTCASEHLHQTMEVLSGMLCGINNDFLHALEYLWNRLHEGTDKYGQPFKDVFKFDNKIKDIYENFFKDLSHELIQMKVTSGLMKKREEAREGNEEAKAKGIEENSHIEE